MHTGTNMVMLVANEPTAAVFFFHANTVVLFQQSEMHTQPTVMRYSCHICKNTYGISVLDRHHRLRLKL